MSPMRSTYAIFTSPYENEKHPKQRCTVLMRMRSALDQFHIFILPINGHVSLCSNEVVREIKQELEDRFVGGEKFQANQMLTQVQKIQEFTLTH